VGGGWWIVDCGLWIMDCGWWVVGVDCGLWIVGGGWWIVSLACPLLALTLTPQPHSRRHSSEPYSHRIFVQSQRGSSRHGILPSFTSYSVSSAGLPVTASCPFSHRVLALYSISTGLPATASCPFPPRSIPCRPGWYPQPHSRALSALIPTITSRPVRNWYPQPQPHPPLTFNLIHPQPQPHPPPTSSSSTPNLILTVTEYSILT
jgi:hypothetical protein